MFSLVQGIAMKNPAVKKFFDVPDMLTTNAPNLKIANPVEKLQEVRGVSCESTVMARSLSDSALFCFVL